MLENELKKLFESKAKVLSKSTAYYRLFQIFIPQLLKHYISESLKLSEVCYQNQSI